MECLAPGFRTTTSWTPTSVSSHRSSRLIWRVESAEASNTALPPEISEIFGIVASGSTSPRAS